jgi:hypothetical protein
MSNYYGREYAPQGEGQYYGAPQQAYGGYENNYNNTYQPPQDNSYRQEDMTVTRYDSEQGRNRHHGHRDERYEDDRVYDERSQSRGRGYYDDRQVAEYDDRRGYSSRDRSRGSQGGDRGFSDSSNFEEIRERGGGKDHHKGKEVGAGVLGAAIGGFAGHEFGHNKMATTIGALAGAWGGYELEKRHEKKKERRDSEQIVEYSSDINGRRSLSRGSGSRSGSVRRSDYNDDEYQRRYDERRSDRY